MTETNTHPHNLRISDLVDEIHVINLERRPDRMAQTAEQLKNETFQRFRAIEPDGYPKSEKGIFGCRLSHIELMQRARALKIPRLMIMEDDFVIQEALYDQLPHVKEFLDSHDWAVFYLGGMHYGDFGKTDNPHIVRANHVMELHAVIYNLSYLDRLVDLIYESDYRLDLKKQRLDYTTEGRYAIDIPMASLIQSRFPCYAAHPFLINQTKQDTDLEGLIIVNGTQRKD